MRDSKRVPERCRLPAIACVAFVLALAGCKPEAGSPEAGSPEAGASNPRAAADAWAEGPGTADGQWQYLGGDAAHTRYSPATEIDADNFADLEEAWIWDGASFGAQSGRSTPSYVNGRLYTVAGPRRYVVALDPASGELIWSWREPHTARWEYSMRQDYGKGVAYAEIDGRGVIYIISPAFFLTALDAESGRPLEGFGKPVPIDGFPQTGEFLWKFNVIPQPGEVGHETWENDAWQWTGDISSWAPLSADQERGIVYVPTNPATIDYYGGFRPGDTLFGTSLIALDVKTGKRIWHYQLVRHDIWNYDTPTAPLLLDVEFEGETVPMLAQATKQNFLSVFNRVTGEPIWPIEDRPVPESLIPGEKLASTQPFPTKPAAYDMQGLTHDDLIDFTPELRQAAIDSLREYQIGPLFHPPLHRDNDLGYKAAFWCPGDGGGSNIDGPTVADPETGIVYVTSRKGCTARIIASGEERDATIPKPTGTTFADYAALRPDGVRGPDDLSLFKPPYSRITAIDLKTGEHLWWIPVGETPEVVLNHPDLKDSDIPNTGTGQNAPMLVTKTLLMYTAEASDGTPQLYAVDKSSGEQIAKVEIPARTRYGAMTYIHDGKQYVVLQTGPTSTAMALADW